MRTWLAKRGYEPSFGARPLGRLIQDKIKKPLAEELLFGSLSNGGVVRVEVKEEKLSFSYPSGDAPMSDDLVAKRPPKKKRGGRKKKMPEYAK